jgi:sporulation protein YlmC with PRC-barrel domain
MQFKNNAEVFTSNGQEVGRINRVVLDPVTKEVTHVIIPK